MTVPSKKSTQGKKQSNSRKGSWFRIIHLGLGKERDYLIENLSMLVAGGMTVPSAIDAVSEDLRSKSMKKILAELREDIDSGSSLWRAFEHAGIFRDHTISLIRLGEETGKLSDNLKLVAEQEEKDRIFRSKIKSAMMYPVFVLSLTIVVGVAIAWFILPRLATVFAQLRVDLPLLTKWLIASGEFLGAYGTIAIPIFFLGIGFILFFTFYFAKTKFIGQALLFSVPGIKKLFQEVELARFGYLLGTLLEAGVPVTQALQSLYDATLFPRYKKLYIHLRDYVQEGNSFQKSFASYKKSSVLVPTTIQRLIITGEQSGHLSETLLKISSTFEERTENTTKNVSVILEPVLLVIVWLGVVAVALAVVLPIYSLIGGLNTDPSQQQEQRVSQDSSIFIQPNEEESVELLPQESLEEGISPAFLEILPTSFGFLNVRDASSLTGVIIGRVTSGAVYEYTSERDGWYEIILETTETGWVFGEYVNIIETP
ncbi:hypothetical protein COV05_00610 [Candidatus Uhrbacteria bacterium CG10_big_fil_rev_8_21_14_0_10_48_16]|uniref:SH3b domain-containing protein n=1 Tax=Candidatus Uhrbacteria bacterium CG10_big_fil_rev_8_21_14_0_10_48_16 TaxID=1975038 RepID=A0A2M8LI28_9BACT|nr:MAG: hypothetical protein COV05_00610 [Candidatus Uhrbacteria bacterium CG10_big_fil_rev_8_21_14_0_10_48_16]